MSTKNMTPEQIDKVVSEHEPALLRGQMNMAIKRLWEKFEENVADNPQSGRALIEKVHLITGERRKTARSLDKFLDQIGGRGG